ncbi:MAG: 2-C-methyl-D-erythritol 4-phosphate cytidylyltransferase [Clostridiales bacterium]|nr:2-C-methyl-D-erythritol 4-phosphate cytidylyltransferase [Clostridiales bacterium]
MVSVIVAAAGSGTRMNSSVKKQFISLLDIPVLIRTLKQFDLKEVDEIIIVTNEDDIDSVKNMIDSYNVNKVKSIIKGGQSRQDSIYNGLKIVKGDVVMIHDAARPFLDKDIILRNLETVSDHAGVVTCVPCKDTIKVVKDEFVKETLNRFELVNVQTPQTFITKKIKEAYDYIRTHEISVTDDASVAEIYGMAVKTVMGSYRNIKLTTPEDLWIGEAILKRG